jgi:hypothetical protein
MPTAYYFGILSIRLPFQDRHNSGAVGSLWDS